MTTKRGRRDPIEIHLTDYIIEEINVPRGVRLLLHNDFKIIEHKLSLWSNSQVEKDDPNLPEVKLFFDGLKFTRFGNSARYPVHIHYFKSYCRGEFAKHWKTVKVR